MGNSLLGALEIATRTDPGVVRRQNEDSVFAHADLGLAILADGMGGYNAGEVASGMATQILSSRLEAAFKGKTAQGSAPGSIDTVAQRLLLEFIAEVNSAIYRAAEGQAQFGGMGTTLVAAVFCDDRLIVAHIGDSRLYRLRGEEFVALTRDHSLLQEQIDSGEISREEARYSANRNLVTRAVGIDPEVETEVHVHPVRPGDVYLLCSDGLYDMVEESDMQHALEMSAANLERAAAELIQMANDSGGEDNISVVVIKVLHEFPAGRGRWSKLWSWFR